MNGLEDQVVELLFGGLHPSKYLLSFDVFHVVGQYRIELREPIISLLVSGVGFGWVGAVDVDAGGVDPVAGGVDHGVGVGVLVHIAHIIHFVLLDNIFVVEVIRAFDELQIIHLLVRLLRRVQRLVQRLVDIKGGELRVHRKLEVGRAVVVGLRFGFFCCGRLLELV